MEHGSRTKLVTAVVLALVFGSGALLGYAADRSLLAEPAEGTGEGEATEGRRRGERRPRSFVYEQLDPTLAQRTRIDSIMEAQREKMNWLHGDFGEARRVYRENYDAVIQDTKEAIAGVFPPELAVEYRQLLADFDLRRAEERSNRRSRK